MAEMVGCFLIANPTIGSECHPWTRVASALFWCESRLSSRFWCWQTRGSLLPKVSGQPRPTGGMGPQPLPLGGGGHDMHGYAFDDEEMMKVRAERGGGAGGWSGEKSRKRALEEAFSSVWIC